MDFFKISNIKNKDVNTSKNTYIGTKNVGNFDKYKLYLL